MRFIILVLLSFNCVYIFSQVGIGTLNPSSSLHVVDDSNATEIKIENPNQSVLTLQAGSPVLRWSTTNGIKALAQWTNNELKFFSSPPQGFPIVLRYPTLSLSEERKVGINLGLIASPSETLEVNGRIKIGSSSDPATEGTLQYDPSSKSFKGFNGSSWLGFTSTLKDDDGDNYIELIEGTTDQMNFITNNSEWMTYNNQVGKLTVNENTDLLGNVYVNGVLSGAFGANFTTSVSGDKGIFESEIRTDLVEIDGYEVSSDNGGLIISRLGNELFRLTSSGKVFIQDLAGSGARFVKVLSSGELYSSSQSNTRKISPYEFTPTYLHLNEILLSMNINNLTELKLWQLPGAGTNSITIYRKSKDPFVPNENPVMQLIIPTNNTAIIQEYTTNTIITSGSNAIDTNNYFYFMDASNLVINQISLLQIKGN
jgi:hypothetical protein